MAILSNDKNAAKTPPKSALQTTDPNSSTTTPIAPPYSRHLTIGKLQMRKI